MSDSEITVVAGQEIVPVSTWLASKKFILVMFFAVVSSIALFASKMDAGEYLTAMGMLTGIYITGNVTQRIKNG